MTTAPYVQLLLANGFEEIEAIAPIDILRRAGVFLEILGVTGLEVHSARGLRVIADTVLTHLPERVPDMLILPGGEPGTTNLANSALVRDMILRQHKHGKWLAAICAAPRILADLGLLKTHQATSFPGVRTDMRDCDYTEEAVVVSKHMITSRGAGTAMAFAYTLLAKLTGEDVSQALQHTMVYS